VVWQGRAGDRSPYADCPAELLRELARLTTLGQPRRESLTARQRRE
jgi:hypothetical protein